MLINEVDLDVSFFLRLIEFRFKLQLTLCTLLRLIYFFRTLFSFIYSEMTKNRFPVTFFSRNVNTKSEDV